MSRRVPFFYRSELRSEQCRERATSMLERTPCLPEEYGIERQARLLEKWFRCVFASAAPRCSSKRRHRWALPGHLERDLRWSPGAQVDVCAGERDWCGLGACSVAGEAVRRGWSWPGAERRGCKLGSRFVLEQHRKVIRGWLKVDWATGLRRVSEVVQASCRSW